jgi:putative ATPase
MKTIKELQYPGGQHFVIVLHDLLYERVDCIVNAANGGLSHGGGVAAAIARAAGPDLEDACEAIIAKRGRLPVGEAVVTTAGMLPFKGVIHAVGPRLGDGDEEGKLVRALVTAFERAHERSWSSLAFPAVSSGIFAVPHDVCARAYISAVEEFFRQYPASPLRIIRLCLYEGPLVDTVRQVLEDKRL